MTFVKEQLHFLSHLATVSFFCPAHVPPCNVNIYVPPFMHLVHGTHIYRASPTCQVLFQVLEMYPRRTKPDPCYFGSQTSYFLEGWLSHHLQLVNFYLFPSASQPENRVSLSFFSLIPPMSLQLTPSPFSSSSFFFFLSPGEPGRSRLWRHL